MRRRTGGTILVVAAIVAVVALPARADWLPAQVAEGAAQQLADRFGALGEVTDREGLVEGTRGIVGAMRGTIDGWGAEGTLERAPGFERFTVPSSGDRWLDAMGRYSVCNLILLRQLEDPAFADDQNARLTSVLGLTSITLAVFRLRDPYVAAGGTQGRIEAYLTSAELEPLFASIQTDAELRADAEARCTPVVVESLQGALRFMAEMGGSE